RRTREYRSRLGSGRALDRGPQPRDEPRTSRHQRLRTRPDRDARARADARWRLQCGRGDRRWLHRQRALALPGAVVVRVLIADDQELVRSGFRLVLELAGIDVVGEAQNGREAVEASRKLRPDVVLMDVRMPEMDGLEATRRIALSGVPSRVLILTTFDLD